MGSEILCPLDWAIIITVVYTDGNAFGGVSLFW